MRSNWHCDTDTPLQLSDDRLQLLQQLSNRLVFHGRIYTPHVRKIFQTKEMTLVEELITDDVS